MDEKSEATNPEQSFSIVVVPENLLEQVMQYVKEISREESDVSGYMMATSLGIGGLPVLNAGSSGSGCKFTDSGKKGFDYDCFDEDK